MSVNICLDSLVLTAKPFVIKLDMLYIMMKSPSVVLKKMGLLSLRSRSQWRLSDQNMIVSSVFSEVLILMQPNLVKWYIIISQSLKDWIVVFHGQGDNDIFATKLSVLSTNNLLSDLVETRKV